MLEKPTLSDAEILACLRTDYGIPGTGLDFLPIGNDATAWVYRVTTAVEKVYFLKVKQGAVAAPSVAVPHYLYGQGIAQVVAPLPTQAGALCQPVGAFILILYPFINGSRGMTVGLSAQQWIAFGALLKQIHTTALPPVLAGQVKQETFLPTWSGVVRTIQRQLARRADVDAFAAELAVFWRGKQAEIEKLVARTEALGRRLQQQPPTFVLCHADCHTANLLVDKDGKLFIVDWDEVLFAPKERDLMFIQGKATPLFFQGYGPAAIDPLALTYYLYEWVVQEIGDFGTRIFLTESSGAATKADAVRGFRQLFQPGDVVEGAYRADRIYALSAIG